MRICYFSLAAAFWLLAGVQSVWITPHLLRLPADYADEIRFAATSSFRDNPTGEWHNSVLIGRRVDQTLVTSATHSIIQGDLHWTNASGVAEFELTGIYGVDRHTRTNLPGYGDVVRTDAFLFPLHTEPKTYQYWDPLFVGKRTATFHRTETISGMDVHVFHFAVAGLDESTGYKHLPDVPERYQAHTEGEGVMWIEPTSGIIVDYEERGRSYFVEPSSGKGVADFYRWSHRYTSESKAAKIRQASAERLRIHILETWLPLGLAIAGVASLFIGWWNRSRSPIALKANPAEGAQ